jgi:CheY-like chemotaxis protein
MVDRCGSIVATINYQLSNYQRLLPYVFLPRPFCVFTRIPKRPLFGHTIGPAIMKILIADDNPRMREVIMQTVADLATEFLEADDGGEAVALCAAERPDWVLMDFRMKQTDGLRATAEIKARFPNIRVVIVSQYDDAELVAEAKRVGACGYVLKENLQELPAILGGGGRKRSSDVPGLFGPAGSWNSPPTTDL